MLRPVVAALIAIAFNSQLVTAEEPTKRPPWTTSRIKGSPEKPEPYRTTPAFPKLRFTLPTCVEEVPGTDRLLVTERDGKIFSFPQRADVTAADLALDLVELLPQDAKPRKVSLWDAEFPPQFAEQKYLFVCYVHPADDAHTRVSRFRVTQSAPLQLDAASELVLITWPDGGHNGGCLEFGTDGMLYISTGDGSGPNPPDGLTVGQTVDDLLGAMLRIDVSNPTAEKPYGVPSDNPFVAGPAGASPEIWSYGYRNPWKFGVDPKTGDTFAADNGWESWEIVHKITRGANGGWPIMEGRAALRGEVKPGPTPIVPPVKDHPHTEANSVIGGPVYRGSQLKDLDGAFIYGDYITGTIWALHPERDGPQSNGAYRCDTLVDTDHRIVAFTQTTAGTLYVLDYDLTGQLYRLEPSGLEDTSATFPRKLSETGLFTSLQPLQTAPGVVPYEVVVPRWLDGAHAHRFVAIPGDGRVRLAEQLEDTADYPEGTVLVKHIELHAQADRPEQRVETQVLHFERGRWNPYSYLWDEDGKDARLVESMGSARTIRDFNPLEPDRLVDRTWHVNAVNECKLCHSAGPKFVLGFVRNQLDRSLNDLEFGGHGQLAHLADRGVIAATSPLADDDASRLADGRDPSQTLDHRARSYLHANCAHCHHPGGNAIASFHLRRELPFDKLNTNKGTGIGTFGLHDPKIIVPGKPYQSILLYRMSKLGYARMPYIGSRVVDGDGVSLVAEWIKSLDPAAASSAASSADEKRVAAQLENTGDALSLATSLHRGELPLDKFQAAVKAGVAARSDVRGLFETFIPEAERRKTLGPNIDPQAILSLRGDRDLGQLIFFSDGARCRNCHEIDDREKSFGPTLHEITKKHPKLGDLLTHALQPSLKIDDPFVAYTAATADGRTLTGLIVEQTPAEVVIRTPEKKVVRLKRSEVEELTKSDKSLMPERILSDLTAQEAADLLEFIRRQKAA
ncbi:MAG: PQQ-dependent sugar dehydrogenase, partial [Planctomycetes bacterium]|nr:PQQ-dependent sugar dehydrogenase [Planctomycetota bacterium]